MVETVLKRISSVRIPAGPLDKSQGIWKSLLEGASRTAEFEKSTLLFLGKKDAAKASLIRAMQVIGCPSRQLTEMEIYGETHGVLGIDYAYMSVRAVDDADLAESLATTDIWILQDADHRHLLDPLISSTHLRHLIVVICLDLSEPWTLKSQLRHWLDFATSFIQDLMKGLPVDEQNALRARLSKYVNGYRSKVEGKPTDEGLAEESTLRVNLGVPFVVCVCKSDFASNLDTRSHPGRADAVLAHLRHLCLPYGAALIYCCTKSAPATRNADLIYCYLLHRIYDFKFLEPAVLTSPESIFVPSGWDTETEIKKFAAATVAEDLETPLETLLPPSVDSGGVADQLHNSIEVQSMNEFLGGLLARDPSLAIKDHNNVHTSKPARPSLISEKQPPAVPREPVKKSTRTSAAAGSESGSAEGGGRLSAAKRHMEAGGGRGDTESLRAFFQTLLTKPSQTVSARPTTPRDGEERRSTKEDHGSAPRKSGTSKREEITDE